MMTFPLMRAFLIRRFSSSLNFDWILGMFLLLCSLLCCKVSWGPGLNRRWTPNSQQLEQWCSKHKADPGRYLLSMPFPGYSLDLLTENPWEQGRLRELHVSQRPQVTATYTTRRLAEWGQLGQQMMKCKNPEATWPEGSPSVSACKCYHAPLILVPGLWKMSVSGNLPEAELPGLWLLDCSFSWKLLGSEASLPAWSPWGGRALKGRLIQAPLFAGRTPHPGREVGCLRSHSLSKQVRVG